MTQRAVVIGGGAIGVASAYYLNLSGWHVTVIDAGEMGHGCSYANACTILPSHSHPLPGPGVIQQALRWMFKKDSPFFVRPRFDVGLMRWGWQFRRFCNAEAAERGFQALLPLSRAGLELFDELAHSGLDFFYRRDGMLQVYPSEQGLEEAQQEQALLEEAGFRTRLLTRPETLDFESALSQRTQGGLFIEAEAHADCLGYVQALAAELERNGARLLTHRAVSRIVVEGGRVKGVIASSPEEVKAADLVVLAAGSWAPSLVEPLGLKIPLQPGKGYSCTIDDYPGSPRVPIIVPEARLLITPLGDRLRFAGTMELAGYDLDVNQTRYQAVVDAARKALNDSLQMRNEQSWSGLRPVLPDGLPIIDRAPGIDGLIVAAGHAMLGFTQSPITGKVVAEMADGRRPSVPLDAFRFDRF
jgi:D-amino-acid dehydrogenase